MKSHSFSLPTFTAAFLLLIILFSPDRVSADEPSSYFGQASEILLPQNIPPAFFTFSPDEYYLEPDDSYWIGFTNWVITQERTQGRRVQSIGEWADRTLSGSNQTLPGNESYIRFGLASESEYGNAAQFEPEVRFRLDIPTVERKLRLVVESESDELIPITERRRNRQLTEDERTDTSVTSAFRLLSELGDAVNLSNDVGNRLRLPADAFWRAEIERQWQTASPWHLTFKQRVYYFHQEGWGARSWFGADRDLGRGWQGRLATEMEWLHADRKFEYSQVVSAHKRLNNRATLKPRLGILGESQPNWRHTSAFADLTFHYRLHSDWLFGEIIPSVEFPRSAGFKDRASLILRIELFFSGNIDRSF